MKRLLRAFLASLNAIKFGWKNEAALRQEMVVFLLALPAGLYLTSNPWKLLSLWGSVLLVMAIEFLNTGIEKLGDRITRQYDEAIKIAKDCGSAAVLIATLIAAGIWVIAACEWFAI